MKIIAAILGVMLIAISTYAGVPGEGIVVAQAVNAQTLMQKAEYHLMRIEMVRQAKTLYDNYVQTKQYYDSIRLASQHRGGLLGFYADKFTDRVRSGATEEWEKIQRMKYADDDTAVKRFMEGGEKALIAKMNEGADVLMARSEIQLASMVDAVNDINKKSKEREVQLIALAAEAKGDMPDKRRDSLLLQAQLLQLEIMASIDRTNRMALGRDLDSYQLAVNNLGRNVGFSKAFEKGGVRQGKVKERTSTDMDKIEREKQIFSILGETPK